MKSRTALSHATVAAVSAMDIMWTRVDAVRDSLREDYIVERPPDSFTAKEYCQRFGLAPATGQHQLEALIRKGILQRKRTTLPDRIGRLVITNVFQLSEIQSKIQIAGVK